MATDIDRSYKEAVEALNTKLLSLSGWKAEASRLKYEGKYGLIIPMINKLIRRSGLTDEEVDRLPMIHITGTKGKGSTSAFTECILRNHGYKTGLFTSPHLVEVRERIRVNGQPLSKEKYCHYFWKVYNKLKETEEPGVPVEEGKGMPAYFAFNMILSLHIFLNEGVDVAIMEVGIGGLRDSTNFIRYPVACAITSLGLEHTDDLGDTIEAIAFQKSGIFKHRAPAITAPQCTSAMQVILDRAKETQSPLFIVEPLSEDVLREYNFNLSIAGDKQRDNAAVAIQLFRLWEAYVQKNEMKPVSQEMKVDEIPHVVCSDLDEATVTGLSSCKWPGRAQTIHREGVTYYLDGAHTKESMELCSSWFSEVADIERKQINGRVIRVLLFFTAPERDPGVLVYPLKDCEFDAAVFCPFVVSTIKSENSPDLQLKILNPKLQQETVERNRLAWDKQVAATERAKNNLRLLEQGWPVLPETHPEPQPARFGSEGSSDKSSIFSDESMSIVSDRASSVESSEDSEGSGRLSPCEDLPTSISDMLNYVLEPSLILNANVLGEVDNINRLKEATPSFLRNKPSATFPCIKEGLRWAAQGRDTLVQVNDPNAVQTPVPKCLRNAAHIQVLATGSLNFVGGVLHVLLSGVADLYS